MHRLCGRELGLAFEDVGDPFGLGFGERRDRSERLDQADEVQPWTVGVDDAAVVRDLVIRPGDEAVVEEWEADLVAGAVDDEVEFLCAAVGKCGRAWRSDRSCAPAWGPGAAACRPIESQAIIIPAGACSPSRRNSAPCLPAGGCRLAPVVAELPLRQETRPRVDSVRMRCCPSSFAGATSTPYDCRASVGCRTWCSTRCRVRACGHPTHESISAAIPAWR